MAKKQRHNKNNKKTNKKAEKRINYLRLHNYDVNAKYFSADCVLAACF